MSEQNSKRTIWSWALYDFANSAFATTVMAGFFPLFFKAYWSNPDNYQESTFYLGIANSLASLITALFAPFIGAVADQGGTKKKFLIFFAFLGILMTGGLWFVRAGFWQLAIFFYIMGSIGFSGGNIFYDSLLPAVASKEKRDYVSSIGFASGYLGGGLLFLLNVIMYLKPALFNIPDGTTAIRLSFLSVSIWWAFFSLPILLFVSDPVNDDAKSFFNAVKSGWLGLLSTFRQIRKMKTVGLFLLAYWFYIDGVDTIIRMAVDYGVALGFPASSLIIALLIVQFVAFPSSILYHFFARKTGVKPAILMGIAAYGVITIFGYFMSATWHFYCLAIGIGFFQGGIQALSRSFYTRLIPENKAGEFFGFFNMLGKFAAVMGPAMMGMVTLLTGSNRIGILSILILFIIGGILLYFVEDK